MNKSHRPGAEEWRQIIDGQANSGLTVAAYCLERGITQGSFYTWKRRLRQAVAAGAVAISGPELKPWGQNASYVRGIEGTLISICTPM
jgi:hypothetical protein